MDLNCTMIGGIQQNVQFRLSFMYIAEIKGKISITILLWKNILNVRSTSPWLKLTLNIASKHSKNCKHAGFKISPCTIQRILGETREILPALYQKSAIVYRFLLEFPDIFGLTRHTLNCEIPFYLSDRL